MSNGRRFRHSRQHRPPTDLERYAAMLAATGMEEREVGRAVLYAERFGLEAMSAGGPDDCVTFDVPSCGDWNCVNPDHQVLKVG